MNLKNDREKTLKPIIYARENQYFGIFRMKLLIKTRFIFTTNIKL